jgi:hypothetical protein
MSHRHPLGRILLVVCVALPATGAAFAGEADVIDVKATAEAGGAWRFDVTVRHADEGWDHYADKWEVLAPDGDVLGVRTRLHPHETEQPFTRSLGGVAVPAGIHIVTVRAHDSVHGYGGATFEVPLY